MLCFGKDVLTKLLDEQVKALEGPDGFPASSFRNFCDCAIMQQDGWICKTSAAWSPFRQVAPQRLSAYTGSRQVHGSAAGPLALSPIKDVVL